MSPFQSQLLLILVSHSLSVPAYADAGGTSPLWPWLSLVLALLLAATIFFCFWLQKQITKLQRQILEKVAESENAQRHLEDVLAEDRYRTTFFRSSYNELRTPLNGIIGFLKLMFQGQHGPLSASGRTQISKCIMLAESLKHQITTILVLADGRRGKLQLQNSRIHLNQLMLEVETMAEGLRLRYPDCHFEIRKLWMNDDGIFIHDNAKLLIILRNLIGNAFKFGKAHERNHVVLAISKRGRAMTLAVSDQGVGLGSEQICRIFDDQAFLNEASGLGLPVVHTLLRLMQGEMKISSKPGVGSKFTVVIPEQSELHLETSSREYLPLAGPHDAAGDKETAPIHDEQPSHNLMKMDGYASHILVVDDNEINCEVIQEILMPQGYRVSLAYGGREALTRMRSDRPDLVLLDLAMPEFTGEQVMQEKQLDSSLADIPVILITARASEQDGIHGLDLGADDYLAKPIIQQELVLRVRNLLIRQRLTKRIALMEEWEKLAQLGELITDLSREIRANWADRNGTEAGRKLCHEVLAALPDAERLGPRFAEVFLSGQDGRDDVDLEALPLPKTDAESLGLLRTLRLQLAPALLSANDKAHIWKVLQNLTPTHLSLFSRVTDLVSTHMHLMEQSQKSRLLMDGILEFHQRRGPQKLCRLDQTLAMTANLLGPRLRLAGVRLNMDLPSQTLTIHPADFMQVAISLITILCQRLEMLLDQDKWLNISAEVMEDLVLIRLTCGGPKLTEAQALRLFDPVAEGAEGTDHCGLHVARRIVLRAPGRVYFDVSGDASCFELELPKALTAIY